MSVATCIRLYARNENLVGRALGSVECAGLDAACTLGGSETIALGTTHSPIEFVQTIRNASFGREGRAGAVRPLALLGDLAGTVLVTLALAKSPTCKNEIFQNNIFANGFLKMWASLMKMSFC